MSDSVPNQSAGLVDYGRIVVGVDGSDDGLRAVEYGARTAALFDADLHLVHAVDDAVLAGAWGVVYDPSVLQEAGEQATQRAVAAAVATGLPADRVSRDVVLGNAAAVLIQLSETSDLIVVGRRSASGLERMFVGSTSLSVATNAKCPVIVISHATNPEVTGGIGAIAVGVDARHPGHQTVRFAFEVAQHRAAKLIVMNVQSTVPAGVHADQLNAEQRDLVAAIESALDDLLAPYRTEFSSVPVDVRVGFGHPADALINLSHEVDMVVMGMHPPKVLGFSIGGVTRAVLAHAGAPLCVVR